jgi:hypothetical protein
MAKAMGQRAGFPDLMILYNGIAYFIEFKHGKGTQTQSQKDFQADLAATGFDHYAVIRSIDELVEILKEWGLAKRGAGLNTFVYG